MIIVRILYQILSIVQTYVLLQSHFYLLNLLLELGNDLGKTGV